MTLHASGAFAPCENPVSRVDAFISQNEFDRPTLVVDLDQVEAQYHALAAGLGDAVIHYAVKANPHRDVVARLAANGAGFDAASRGEIADLLDQGIGAGRISFGNTIKRARDIAWAYDQGVDLFSVDAEEEMRKIAAHAPGARVYVRLLVPPCGADWPLSRKFGCDAPMAMALLDLARDLGLRPVGLSFHVGSQTRRAEMWTAALDHVAAVWHRARDAGHDLSLLNIGGGFPAFHGHPIEAPTDYARSVRAMVDARFGPVPVLMAEPGRGMVAEAGAIACEVMLVSRKSDEDLYRWVYLDIGRFSGLAETEGEAIRYALSTPHDGGACGPCVLAGPSCDSADVMYEKTPVSLPLDLAAGDRVIIRNTGAYTSAYSSVGFNGFPPLEVVTI